MIEVLALLQPGETVSGGFSLPGTTLSIEWVLHRRSEDRGVDPSYWLRLANAGSRKATTITGGAAEVGRWLLGYQSLRESVARRLTRRASLTPDLSLPNP